MCKLTASKSTSYLLYIYIYIYVIGTESDISLITLYFYFTMNVTFHFITRMFAAQMRTRSCSTLRRQDSDAVVTSTTTPLCGHAVQGS